MSSFEAKFYEPRTEGTVRCLLCPHFCEIPQGNVGKCGVRSNYKGKLFADSFAKVNSVALDPIEKKPLHFFHPGSWILSVGTFGCNLDCPFCQNHRSVRQRLDINPDNLMPSALAVLAKKYASRGNIGVAYTYNEPLVGYEYVYECAKQVKILGLKNILVTNGFINPEPLNELLPLVDAMNIDLKGFTQDFYVKLGGELEAVKQAITIAAGACHVEVTMLVVPGENENDIEEAAKWIAKISPEIPMHITRFFPRYKYASHMPTPIETLQEAALNVKKHLSNVVIGNVK